MLFQTLVRDGVLNLQHLWYAAKMHWQSVTAQKDRVYGRQMGRHVKARLARAQAKRLKAGKTPYQPE